MPTPIEVIKEVEKIVEIPVEKEVERIVEKIVEVPTIIEKIVEVPVEKIIEKIVEVPTTVEKIIQDPVLVKERDLLLDAYNAEIEKNKEIENRLNNLIADQEKLKNEVKPNLIPQLELSNSVLDQLSPQADNFDPFAERGSATFGTAWPMNPVKGDLFLKVDSKPNKLYKWNGRKWIEIDRHRINDTLVYDPAYIDFVIDQVRRGHRDYEDLSEAERTQIMDRIKQRGNNDS